ncbi:GNAT family N-acetyltransferase [Brevibacillus reuszeri]|uniref:GNAT family N-acetyltransferase n=1 Tax=Brevibacillus reuszeri TaxID=54915 RepID=UPI000CCC8513|nr:GNAT family N-acetyltransferase [Brevibacillus reuszeri]
MQIKSSYELSKQSKQEFFTTHWGSPKMVISSGVFQCDELEGYAVHEDDGTITGYISYVIDGDTCEIISLDSLVEQKGIGTALVQKAEEAAKQAGCSQMKLVTTNDNLHALGFYQRRGYQFSELYINAVDKARRIKPEIPLVADNGIPIRDEILLVKKL